MILVTCEHGNGCPKSIKEKNRGRNTMREGFSMVAIVENRISSYRGAFETHSDPASSKKKTFIRSLLPHFFFFFPIWAIFCNWANKAD